MKKKLKIIWQVITGKPILIEGIRSMAVGGFHYVDNEGCGKEFEAQYKSGYYRVIVHI